MYKSLPLKRIARWCVAGLFVVAALWLLLVGIIQWVIFPQIPTYKAEIETYLQQALQAEVRIDQLEGRWSGLRPQIRIQNITIQSVAEDGSRTSVAQVQELLATVAWRSILHLSPQLSGLHIQQPEVVLQRSIQGDIQLGERLLIPAESSEEPTDWSWLALVLQHGGVVLEQGRLTWIDHQRQAPPLVLEQLQLTLQTDPQHIDLNMSARPPDNLAQSIQVDMRSDLRPNEDPLNPYWWTGHIRGVVQNGRLPGVLPWLEIPEALHETVGSAELKLTFQDNQWQKANVQVQAEQLGFQLAPDLDPVQLPYVEGKVEIVPYYQGIAVTAEQLKIITPTQRTIEPEVFTFRWTPQTDAEPAQGSFSFRYLELDSLAAIVPKIPLPEIWKKHIIEANPKGVIRSIALDWAERDRVFSRLDGHLIFENIFIEPEKAPQSFHQKTGFLRPGVDNLTGDLSVTLKGAHVRIQSEQLNIYAPGLLEESKIAWDHFSTEVSIALDPLLKVTLHSLEAKNADLHMQLRGAWHADDSPEGHLRLEGKLPSIQLAKISRYLPTTMNKNARTWLKRSVLGGVARAAEVHIDGPIHSFPYAPEKDPGRFEWIAPVEGLVVDFSTPKNPKKWSHIQVDKGLLLMENASVTIDAEQAVFTRPGLENVPLFQAKAVIPDLEAGYNAYLHVSLQLNSAAQPIIDHLQISPIYDLGGGLLEDLKVSDGVQAQLYLGVALDDQNDDVIVQGTIDLPGNTLHFLPNFPAVQQAHGQILFSDIGWEIPHLEGTWMSGPLQILGSQKIQPYTTLAIKGRAAGADIARFLEIPTHRLSGQTAYTGTIHVSEKGRVEVDVQTDLKGLAAHLPIPLHKRPEDIWISQLHYSQFAGVAELLWETENWVKVQLRRERQGQTPKEWVAGAISIGEVSSNPMPHKGFRVAIEVPYLPVDPWVKFYQEIEDLTTVATDSKKLPVPVLSDGASSAYIIYPTEDGTQWFCRHHARIFLKVGYVETIQSMKNVQAEVQCGVSPYLGHWQFTIDSEEVAGGGVWRPVKGTPLGAVQAHFSKVFLRDIGKKKEAEASAEALGAIAPQRKNSDLEPNDLPNLQIGIDRFSLDGELFGQLQLDAALHQQVWRIRKVQFTSAGGTVIAEGYWGDGHAHPVGDIPVSVEVQMVLNESGQWLQSIGLEAPLHAGIGVIQGNLSWLGLPYVFRWETMSGHLRFDLRDGEIHPIESGPLRWLNLVSIRSVPRRLRGEFNDLMPERFLYHRIVGDVKIQQGKVETDNLRVVGAGADATIKGSVHIPNRRYDLVIQVHPKVDVGIASVLYGVLSNPPVGATTLALQILLSKPISQGLAFGLLVEGPWDAPVIQAIE